MSYLTLFLLATLVFYFVLKFYFEAHHDPYEELLNSDDESVQSSSTLLKLTRSGCKHNIAITAANASDSGGILVTL